MKASLSVAAWAFAFAVTGFFVYHNPDMNQVVTQWGSDILDLIERGKP